MWTFKLHREQRQTSFKIFHNQKKCTTLLYLTGLSLYLTRPLLLKIFIFLYIYYTNAWKLNYRMAAIKSLEYVSQDNRKSGCIYQHTSYFFNAGLDAQGYSCSGFTTYKIPGVKTVDIPQTCTCRFILHNRKHREKKKRRLVNSK